MSVSVFDLFKIGIGPSSSHTVGPMVAATRFCDGLETAQLLGTCMRVKVQLFGSLGATGKGHGSDKAILLGLLGETPAEVDVTAIDSKLDAIRGSGRLMLLGKHRVAFDESTDIVMHRRKSLPYHPNAMRFEAFNEQGECLVESVYYSVGGGFVLDESAGEADDPIIEDDTVLPYGFTSAEQLLV